MEKDIPTVGFQGESGAYSEKAVQLYFSEVTSRSYRSFSDLFLAIENDQIDLAILPIENSIEGSVIESYELLLRSDLSVVGEINVKVDHCLISHHNTKKEDIDVIYSHTQALGQCKSYLKKIGWPIWLCGATHMDKLTPWLLKVLFTLSKAVSAVLHSLER